MLESGAHHKFMKLSECCQKQTRLCKQRTAESMLQENFFDSVEETLIFTLHLRLKSIVQGTVQTAKSFHAELPHCRHSKHRHYLPPKPSTPRRGTEMPRESQTRSSPHPAWPVISANLFASDCCLPHPHVGTASSEMPPGKLPAA